MGTSTIIVINFFVVVDETKAILAVLIGQIYLKFSSYVSFHHSCPPEAIFIVFSLLHLDIFHLELNVMGAPQG